MSELIVSVSGLRGVVGACLNPLVAARYAAAFAPQLAPGPLVVTRDGRSSGRMLRDSICGALCAVGRDVWDGDVAATPTTGRLVRQYQAAGGVQISASHNPAEYNGIKLFGSDGRVIPLSLGERVLDAFNSETATWESHLQLGTVRPIEDSIQDHLQAVLKIVRVPAIRAAAFHVLLDANHGAGSVLGIPLLEALGCRVTCLGRAPDGQFAHLPEPTAANLASTANEVRAQRADVGFCQDPDADRLALIDESGRYVGEEFTLAVCLDHVLRSHPGPVVTNCSTSRMSELLAQKYGVPFSRSRVGEAHVADRMLETNAIFGGEGNGGPIDPRVGLVRDSFVGMALVLDALAERQQPLSQLVATLPQLAMHKTTVPLAPAQMPDALDRLARTFPEASASRLDGLRLDWLDRWLLVRGSNTEPIVRLVTEAPTPQRAEELCTRAAAILGHQAAT